MILDITAILAIVDDPDTVEDVASHNLEMDVMEMAIEEGLSLDCAPGQIADYDTVLSEFPYRAIW